MIPTIEKLFFGMMCCVGAKGVSKYAGQTQSAKFHLHFLAPGPAIVAPSQRIASTNNSFANNCWCQHQLCSKPGAYMQRKLGSTPFHYLFEYPQNPPSGQLPP